MTRKSGLFLLLCAVVVNVSDNALFIPTHEWQEIAKGDSVPAGKIHVRMDFETGKRFAKIREDNTRNIENEIVSAEKEVKKDSLPPQPPFRTLEEIRKEFAKVSAGFETETSVVQKMTKKFKNEKDVSMLIMIINELEGLVHGLDNAKLFVDFGGMERVVTIISDLNQSISSSFQSIKISVSMESSNNSKVLQNHDSDENNKKLLNLPEKVKISTPEENFSSICLPLMKLLFASLQNNNYVQRNFSNVSGIQKLDFVITHAYRIGNSACLKKGVSVLSAALRGCEECFLELYNNDSSIIMHILDMRDVNITGKLVDMFRSLYAQAQESTDPLFMQSLKNLILKYRFCEETQKFIGMPRFGSDHDLLVHSFQMFKDLCGISTS